MKTHLEYEKPMDIEARSMELIAAELPHPLDPENEAVIKRVIHTTADFDYVARLTFTPGAVAKGVAALRD
ncbi:MAG: precorrin-8X methylmutase, partial [Clostridiales bacterium]|nr:precorrin-8X methylmutase [Clostridiales bacterium]